MHIGWAGQPPKTMLEPMAQETKIRDNASDINRLETAPSQLTPLTCRRDCLEQQSGLERYFSAVA